MSESFLQQTLRCSLSCHLLKYQISERSEANFQIVFLLCLILNAVDMHHVLSCHLTRTCLGTETSQAKADFYVIKILLSFSSVSFNGYLLKLLSIVTARPVISAPFCFISAKFSVNPYIARILKVILSSCHKAFDQFDIIILLSKKLAPHRAICQLFDDLVCLFHNWNTSCSQFPTSYQRFNAKNYSTFNNDSSSNIPDENSHLIYK